MSVRINGRKETEEKREIGVDNYELHMKVHTCHADCQNPICIAVKKAVAEEREACAKVCEELGYHVRHGGWTCADAIRERGQG